jgi:hypothetical protein
MLFAILIRIPEFFRSLFSRAANAANQSGFSPGGNAGPQNKLVQGFPPVLSLKYAAQDGLSF